MFHLHVGPNIGQSFGGYGYVSAWIVIAHNLLQTTMVRVLQKGKSSSDLLIQARKNTGQKVSPNTSLSCLSQTSMSDIGQLFFLLKLFPLKLGPENKFPVSRRPPRIIVELGSSARCMETRYRFVCWLASSQAELISSSRRVS
jgi:hypothetical protein